MQTYAPDSGVYLVAALAGTTDVDAITLSMAQYARTGAVEIAGQAIIIATFANTVVKAAMAGVLGSAALRKPVLLATAAVLAAGSAALLLG
jgi:uncharacterized membrane protein (DUF4010 family)